MARIRGRIWNPPLRCGGAMLVIPNKSLKQKIPEQTFEDFGADEGIFPQAGELSAGQFAPALRRRRPVQILFTARPNEKPRT